MGTKPPVHLPGYVLLLLGALVLAGCGHVDVTTDFYRGGRWETVITYRVAQETLAMIGAQEMVTELDEFVREAADQGVRAKWKQESIEGGVAYAIMMKGEGLDTLSQVVFDGDAEIRADESGDRRLIHFSQRLTSGDFESHTLTLRGGEIIEGNGEWVDSRTMTWENHYGDVYAILTERGRGGAGRVLAIVALVILGVGIVLGGIYWWQRRRASGPAPCPACGFWVPEGARFCPGCGRPR
jgi:hypothetical protein